MAKDSPGRIPTLDGIRAVAIVLVVFAHSLGTPHGFDSKLLRVSGDVGVRIFFVLSGFLITTLLVREHARTGRISYRAFFTRRLYRIFPAFYVYIAAMSVLTAAGVIDLPAREVLWAATYTMNFHQPETWWVGHLWSLAVEEQFYVVWPLTVSLLAIARARTVAIAAIVFAPMARLVATRWFPDLGEVADHGFPFIFDGLAIGCVLAMSRTALEANPRYLAFLKSPVLWVIVLAGLATPYVFEPSSRLLPNGYLAELAKSASALAVGLAIHRLVLTPDIALGRLLETAPLVWLGTISYSLYLWQQPFVNRLATGWFARVPVNFAFAFVGALASYYLVERPILRWRTRRMGH